ncbi:MAG: LacI family DNA-binding transcriptional regulator [Bryobacteraceae bacterium]
MATIYDVAKRAKVSTYTVSSVLNRSAYVSPELTMRVQQAVRELDYTINDLARSLQTRRTRTIGMLIPDIANPFYAKVVRAAEERLKRDGYSLILGNTYNDEAEQSRYLGVFRSKQVDGLLLFVSAGDEEDARKLVEARKPVVFVGRVPRTFEADTVTADNIRGSQLATEHLIGKGHKTIALIPGQLALSASSDRVAGWRRALRKHKLPAPAGYVRDGDWTVESGRSATLSFLDLPQPPTAILAANFLMMTGVLRALKERSISCPRQVEVMSWDDSEWLDVFAPPVSTVATPSAEMGERAADLLLKRMRHPARKFERISLPSELHIRG